MVDTDSNPNFMAGYYSYIGGELDNPQQAIDALHANNDFMINILNKIMYSIIDEPDSYYRNGFNRFSRAVFIYFDNNYPHLHRNKFTEILKYYYNRQLIVQMTSIPKQIPGSNIHIPIDRSPEYEIQADIVQLSSIQSRINYNLSYMLVLIDPFSRFMWSHPVGNTTSVAVKNAFNRAFSRPGLPNDYYLHIRDKVKRIVVDGGSEFKAKFPRNIKYVFPNASIITATAKSKTNGRPTNTGPVEAGIATFRRVVRDYELGVNHRFLSDRQSGLNHILESYNAMKQTQTLRNLSPNEVATSMMSDKPMQNLVVATVDIHMQQMQHKKIEQKAKVLAEYGISEKTWLTRNRHGDRAYRLFLPPHPFIKQVDFRVGKELFVIKNAHGTDNNLLVDLIEYGNGTKTMNNIHLQQLVLVCAPVDDGPPIIRQNLMRQLKDLEWSIKKKTPKQTSMPYEITPEIVAAIGPRAPRLNRLRLVAGNNNAAPAANNLQGNENNEEEDDDEDEAIANEDRVDNNGTNNPKRTRRPPARFRE
eukprot:gene8047-16497_t